jgi:twitching motility two-component system response regulator PilG
MGESAARQPYRVLIVEDSATIRYAYKLLLDNDYDVLFAEDPLSALKQVATLQPDAVLLDINLKDRSRELATGQSVKKMDGLDVCAAIKRSPFRSTPIIMVTSRDGLIDKMRGKFARADRYLTKPVDQNDLKRALNDLLSRKTVARRLKNSPYMASVYTPTSGEEA